MATSERSNQQDVDLYFTILPVTPPTTTQIQVMQNWFALNSYIDSNTGETYFIDPIGSTIYVTAPTVTALLSERHCGLSTRRF